MSYINTKKKTKNNMETSQRIARGNRRKFDEENYKFHSEDGVHFLTSGSVAPSGSYYGFMPITDVTVSSIDYITGSLQTGDITAVGYFPAGMYVSIPGLFSNIAIGGDENALLFKRTV